MWQNIRFQSKAFGVCQKKTVLCIACAWRHQLHLTSYLTKRKSTPQSKGNKTGKWIAKHILCVDYFLRINCVNYHQALFWKWLLEQLSAHAGVISSLTGVCTHRRQDEMQMCWSQWPVTGCCLIDDSIHCVTGNLCNQYALSGTAMALFAKYPLWSCI